MNTNFGYKHPNITIALRFALLAIVSISVIALLAAVFSGCAAKPVAQSDPNAVVAEAPATPTPTQESFTKTLGDVYTWDDGVSMSVSPATTFEPGEYSMGYEEGTTALAFTVTLTNGSDQPLKPNAFVTLASGGVESTKIFDNENALGDISITPTTSVLPGQSITWVEGFSALDPNSLTLEVTPDFGYNAGIFTQ